jgi:hypothetical protein
MDYLPLLEANPIVFAQHLTMLESRLYMRIQRQECLNWAMAGEGPKVANLYAFISTRQRIRNWVRLSVLYDGYFAPRARVVDFWIQVAEVQRLPLLMSSFQVN